MSRTERNFWLDVTIFMTLLITTYIATNVFGAVAWALHFGDGIYVVNVPDRSHVVFGVMWTILVTAHLALHWKWITSTTQRCIVPGPSRSTSIQ